MKTQNITNQNLFQVDWSAQDRQRMLRSIPRMKRSKPEFLAPGLPAQGSWMNDVSAMDRRSVKAALAGRGDLRVSWWKINRGLHRALFPHAEQESIMYWFHKRHHFLTLGWLQFKHDVQEVHRVIVEQGAIAGLRKTIALNSESRARR